MWPFLPPAPLLDLAGFCEAWCTGDRDSPQWPSRRQLIGRYTAQRNLPADLDLSKYRAVTIWCKRFSVNFGTAPLTGQG